MGMRAGRPDHTFEEQITYGSYGDHVRRRRLLVKSSLDTSGTHLPRSSLTRPRPSAMYWVINKLPTSEFPNARLAYVWPNCQATARYSYPTTRVIICVRNQPLCRTRSWMSPVQN